MKTTQYTGTLTPRATMIRTKLEYKGKIEPTSTGVKTMHATENISFGYDIDLGEIKVTLNKERLKESIQEFKAWMKSKKVPLEFEGDSTFFMEVSELTIGDIAILESEGFIKKDVVDGNSENFIWELFEHTV